MIKIPCKTEDCKDCPKYLTGFRGCVFVGLNSNISTLAQKLDESNKIALEHNEILKQQMESKDKKPSKKPKKDANQPESQKASI